MADEKQTLEVVKFERNNIPVNWESKEVNNDTYIKSGVDNLYPNYLLYLYNNSPIHSAIVNGKTTYILGNGLRYLNGSNVEVKVNASDSIKEFTDKVIKDYLIFNYMAVEVVFNVFGEPIQYFHVPAHRIRVNKDKNKFWYNEDWTYNRRYKNIIYDRWTEDYQGSTSRLFFFDGYFPSVYNVYARPEYEGSIKAIATDIAIRDFNLNNIKNHFSPSNIITFYQGSNISEEQKRKVINDLKASYSGEFGKKYIVDFQVLNGKSADVKSLSAGDWDKAFTAVRQDTNDDILRGHQVVSPMLFCVKTEGQLGGASELATSYEIFKNTWVNSKRTEVESALNQLFSNFKQVKGKLMFEDKPLFATDMSETLKERIFTINELRAEQGAAPLPDGDRLISQLPKVTEAVVDPQGNKISDKEIVQPASLPLVQHKQFKSLTDEDFEKIKHLGTSKKKFHVIGRKWHIHSKEDFATVEQKFDDEQDIASYLLDNDIKNLTISQIKALIRKDLGITTTTSDLKDTLKHLQDAGVIDVQEDGGKIAVTPPTKAKLPKSKGIFIRYSYELRPEVEGPVLLDTSRGFCKKLIENDRYYSREDIQYMSSIWGFDVMEHTGGFWHDSQNDVTYNHCRHKFVAYALTGKEEAED